VVLSTVSPFFLNLLPMKIEANTWYLTRDKKHAVYVLKLICDEHGYVERMVCSDDVPRNERGMYYRCSYHALDLTKVVKVHQSLVSSNPC